MEKKFNQPLCNAIINIYKNGEDIGKYYEKVNVYDINILYNYDNKNKTDILDKMVNE